MANASVVHLPSNNPCPQGAKTGSLDRSRGKILVPCSEENAVHRHERSWVGKKVGAEKTG